MVIKMVYKISVIIPCHNSQLTLERCIDSIINQTFGFENIELILYDNGSSDYTRNIIQSYSDKFTNIVPLYSDIDSGFPGTGRGKGIEVASSEYIMFIDSDDEYDSQICEKLYNAIINEKADIVSCNKMSIDGDKVIKETTFVSSKFLENGQFIITGEDIILFKDVAVWNKIYKKEIISKNNLKFLENSTADDFVFAISYFLKSKKLIYLKDYWGYKYRVYSESVSHNFSKEYIPQLLIGFYYIYDILKKENKEEFMDDIIKYHIFGVLFYASHLNLSYNEFKSILNEILVFENEINFSSKLDDFIFNIINWFILNKKFNFAITCLKLINNFRKISFLQKIFHLILKFKNNNI